MKKTYHIPDMHCPNCPMHLEAIQDDLPGIQKIKGSYQKQSLEIEFDENLVNENQIRTAIQDIGYRIGNS